MAFGFFGDSAKSVESLQSLCVNALITNQMINTFIAKNPECYDPIRKKDTNYLIEKLKATLKGNGYPQAITQDLIDGFINKLRERVSSFDAAVFRKLRDPYPPNPDRLISINNFEKLLKLSHEQSPYIVWLSVNFNNLDMPILNTIAPILSTMIHLQHLDFSHNKPGEAEAEALASALMNMHHLTVLYLDHNNFEITGIEAIATALSNKSNLERLSFNDNNLGVAGAKAIALAQYLSLAKNNFGVEGIEALIPAFATMKNMRDLYLYENKIGAAQQTKIRDIMARTAPNCRIVF